MKRLVAPIFIVTFVSAAVMARASSYSLSGVREVPVPMLADLAIASFDQFGPVIYYNPILAQRVGPEVTAFARAHEYGHIIKHHLQKSMFASNPYYHVLRDRENEVEADKFATEYWEKENPAVLDAVIVRDLTDLLNAGDMTHLPSPARAALIQQWRAELRNGGSRSDADEARRQTCPKCNGEGKLTINRTCPRCFGRGMLICANCRGRGGAIDYYGLVHPCLVCGGVGQLVCLTCDRSGTVTSRTSCARCSGTGKITVRNDH